MKKVAAYLFLLIIYIGFCPAQNIRIDSLLSSLKISKEDTNKVNTLNQLSKHAGWAVGDLEKAMQFGLEAKALAEKTHYKKGIASAYNNIGIVEESYGNYQEALENYFSSMKITEEIGDKRGIASSLNNIGIVYYFQGNYPPALKNYFAALKIREEIGDRKQIASSYDNIGLVYANQGNYTDALKNHLAALKIMEESGDKYGIATSYNSIGAVYEKQGYSLGNDSTDRDSLFKLSLKNHYASLKIKKEIGDKYGIAASLNNIGTVYYYQKNYTAALENYLHALDLRREIEDKNGIATSYSNIGSAYIYMGKVKEGKSYQEKALMLSKETGEKQIIQNSYGAMAEADNLLGNYKGAFENYKMYIVYRDSLLNEENTKKTVQVQMQFDFDKKEAIAKTEHQKELENQKNIAEEKNRRQRIVSWSVLGGLALVLVFAGFIFRALRVTRKQKQIIEEQKLAVEHKKAEVEVAKHIIEEKNKDILASIHYAKRIQTSLMPTEKYIERKLQNH